MTNLFDGDINLVLDSATQCFSKQTIVNDIKKLIEPVAVKLSIDLKELDSIYLEALNNLFDGANYSDVNTAFIIALRTRVELDNNYTYLIAAILDDNIRKEVCTVLDLPLNSTDADILLPSIQYGIKVGRISPIVLEVFTREEIHSIAQQLNDARSSNLTYLSLQTLYDRYFLHDNDMRYETAQVFFARVAIGHAIKEKVSNHQHNYSTYTYPNTRHATLTACELRQESTRVVFLSPTLNYIVDLYEMYSEFDFMSSTPTLFNSATIAPQMSSCYLTTVPDDLAGIYDALKDDALLSKFAGGLGNDWTPVRALNAYIKGTNGKSQGVVPFLKVANDTAVAVNQGGKRKGAMCAYLETWHLDVEEFLELRKNTGDDRRRTHDMNTANWIPDLFMKRVLEDGPWTLFTPNEVPDLHEIYGRQFEVRYTHYEAVAKEQGLLHKVVRAVDLWRKMLGMLFETGHPWVTFKDACNIRSPQDHVGVVHSSNLCTEITLNTSYGSDAEVAVCNLGSINIVRHITDDGQIDKDKLKRTIYTAIRTLDNVIDENMYPIESARRSNMRHRPIGLGVMGFHDALYKLNIPYASQAAVEFADELQELISYYAISASSDLAVIRGSYETFEGSKWSRGILPIDSLKLLENDRGAEFCDFDYSTKLGKEVWNELRNRVINQGMRNSNVMAIAPTATISNICGVSQSIEPTFQNVYVKSNLSGEFTVTNKYLQETLTKLGLWNRDLIAKIKDKDGSIQGIPEIPSDVQAMFATAFEVGGRWLVECAARRQKWIDQAQSLNLYIANADGKKLDLTYKMSWVKGLKTTYYLRAKGATSTEKVTGTSNLNAVKPVTVEPAFTTAAPVPQACSIDNPECEACQ